MKARTIILVFCGYLGIFGYGCGNKFLDIKPNAVQRVPETIDDYLGLMNNISTMNKQSSHLLGTIGADEIYLNDNAYNTFPTTRLQTWQRNAYTWSDVIYEGGEGNPVSSPLDWNLAYERILWTNIALDGLEKIAVPEGKRSDYNNAVGIALFHRAFNYYSLAQLYCAVYDVKTANQDKGLPLRLDPDVTTAVNRSSNQATYEQILEDLLECEKLLPEVSMNKFLPDKSAAYALLARVYLQMGDYNLAHLYSDQCIRSGLGLLDYNNIDYQQNPTFGVYGEGNPEIVWMNSMPRPLILAPTIYSVDPELLAIYESGDTRVRAFFDENASGDVLFKGSYEGTAYFFTGVAADELYLTRAECAVRLGNLESAVNDLTYFIENRYDEEYLPPIVTTDVNSLLDSILMERRRQLVFRGIRWEDIRRLNREERYRQTLKRTVNGAEFKLLPESPRYIWPIPLEAIQVGGYVQNDR